MNRWTSTQCFGFRQIYAKLLFKFSEYVFIDLLLLFDPFCVDILVSQDLFTNYVPVLIVTENEVHIGRVIAHFLYQVQIIFELFDHQLRILEIDKAGHSKYEECKEYEKTWNQ